MTAHIFLPGIRLCPISLLPQHEKYLRDWRTAALTSANDDDVCASMCLQTAFIELSTDGRLTTDWLGIFDACLTGASGWPVAYSAKYAKRLHGFENQSVQSTIVAAHTRWWLATLRDDASVDHTWYAQWLLKQKYKDGLIYDHDVSDTVLHHRMRTELTMSLAYALEILCRAKMMNKVRDNILASLVDSHLFPPSRCMSTEYFRLQALKMLNATCHFPNHIEKAIEACKMDLAVGFCDFAMVDKRDSYMGTAKRTDRDKPIHSPLTACHVMALLPFVQSNEAKKRFEAWLAAYSDHLRENPLDIPAFQMRDVPVPFGADKTPIEVLCAAHLIENKVRP